MISRRILLAAIPVGLLIPWTSQPRCPQTCAEALKYIERHGGRIKCDYTSQSGSVMSVICRLRGQKYFCVWYLPKTPIPSAEYWRLFFYPAMTALHEKMYGCSVVRH